MKIRLKHILLVLLFTMSVQVFAKSDQDDKCNNLSFEEALKQGYSNKELYSEYEPNTISLPKFDALRGDSNIFNGVFSFIDHAQLIKLTNPASVTKRVTSTVIYFIIGAFLSWFVLSIVPRIFGYQISIKRIDKLPSVEEKEKT